jgi:murein DD-endopeptidase MepM/ murein hydrolase activator NlpD
LQGFSFPIQLRAFSEIPRTRDDLLSARKAAFFSSEERVTGLFPLAPGRLWHSGVHLRGLRGAPVSAPTRGRLVAARLAEVNGSSTSFVLIRHEADLDGRPFTFYSLLAHLALPAPSETNPVAWMQALAKPERAGERAALESGAIILLDERIETGDLLGFVGMVKRGSEQGPELHFEIFTTEKPPSALERTFRLMNAAADGPIVRRADLIALVDKNADSQIDARELRGLFQGGGDLAKRQALRRLAVLHRHEWGDRTTLAEFVGLRELSAIPRADRQRIYEVAIKPYLFWTDALARHAGLPLNQVIYSYNPLTFLLALAAHATQIEIPWPREGVADGGVEPRRLSYVPVDDWLKPAVSDSKELQLPPLIGVDLQAKRKDQIPLIELPPTDQR